MLLFIYSDKLPNIYEVMGSTPMCSFTVMVQHLLVAADLYNLYRLKLSCESKLCEGINTDTVATTLALAEQHHCSQLKAICLKFIANPANLGGAFIHGIWTWKVPSYVILSFLRHSICQHSSFPHAFQIIYIFMLSAFVLSVGRIEVWYVVWSNTIMNGKFVIEFHLENL